MSTLKLHCYCKTKWEEGQKKREDKKSWVKCKKSKAYKSCSFVQKETHHKVKALWDQNPSKIKLKIVTFFKKNIQK